MKRYIQLHPYPAENCSELAHLPCFRYAYYLGTGEQQ